jgi:hypothetical protein
VELREAEPARSTFQIVDMLDRMYPQQQGPVKRSTLARHFRQLGKTRQVLDKEQKSGYRHFRKRHKGDLWETDICLPDLQVRDTDGQVRKAVLVGQLTNGLPRRGFNPSEIEQMLGGNFLRLLDTVW